MKTWEDRANECPEYIIEAQIERRREQEFAKQIIELSHEGMDAKMIALKLGVDEDVVKEILKQEEQHG